MDYPKRTYAEKCEQVAALITRQVGASVHECTNCGEPVKGRARLCVECQPGVGLPFTVNGVQNSNW